MLVEGDLGETPVIGTYEPTLDTAYVFENPGEEQFTPRDGQIEDETGNVCDPDALPLETVLAFDAMWFAWSGYYQDTTLYV